MPLQWAAIVEAQDGKAETPPSYRQKLVTA
jgi:hypothetical protein